MEPDVGVEPTLSRYKGEVMPLYEAGLLIQYIRLLAAVKAQIAENCRLGK